MMQVAKLLKEYKLSSIEDVDENGNSLLHLTINNDTFTRNQIRDILEIWLDNGIDPNVKNKTNETALHLAVKNRMRDVIDLLLAHNANMDYVVHYVIEDEYKTFHELSANNNNFNEFGDKIKTVESERANYIEWLICKGFDFDCTNKVNKSALSMAIDRNLQHVLPTLLKYTRNISFVDQNKRSLLHLFLEKNVATNNYSINRNWYAKRYAVDIVKILLNRGLSADAKDIFGHTPTQIAIEKKEDIDIVATLLEHTNNVNHEDFEKETLFHTTIKKWANSEVAEADYYMKIARNLIARGANIDKPKNNEYRPLFHAIQANNLSIVEFLRDNGANFNVTTRNGETVMHRFLGCNGYVDADGGEKMLKLFDLLLELTTDVRQKNCRGQSVFYVVLRKWIYSTGTKTDYFMKIARALVAKGADVNETDESGMTALVHAIRRQNLGAVEFLEENEADFNVTPEDGGNLIHLLVKSTNCNETVEKLIIRLLDILVRHGCQVNSKDGNGMTPLDIVVHRGNLAITQKLLEHGAHVNCRNDQMKTPLRNMLTSYHKLKTDVAELLLEYGANIDAEDSEGFTALHAVTVYRANLNVNLLLYLLEHGADFNARTRERHSVLRMAVWYDYKNITWDSKQVELECLPSLATCLGDDTSKEVEILFKHWIKLKVANLECGDDDDEFKDLIKQEKYKRYCEECLKEIAILKEAFIDSHTSFYTLLHMDLNSRRAYVHGEQRLIIQSPILKEQFPQYATLILASYYEAVVRQAILNSAIEAWLVLTKIELPDVCIEHIFSFLSNSDLFVIIENY